MKNVNVSHSHKANKREVNNLTVQIQFQPALTILFYYF